MADLSRGKTIFESRVEYPLPAKSGVRDYVFHFVPRGDGYGGGAHYFFERFYPKHTAVEVASLEGLINTLQQAVTGGGVQQIREIVIVSHGNAFGLLFRLLEAGDSANPEFKYLTALSLAQLQADVLDGKLAGFAAKRQAVLAHLNAESWVTVRACNFGQSREGLYALYSFFGGAPNVYAPMEYQFFGSQPVLAGMRFESTLKVHEHLVRQHYLPKDVHTPERQDAIVRALLDPGAFSEPFELAAMRLDGASADETQHYEGLIDDLNAGRISDALKGLFAAQSLPLSGQARLVVLTQNTAWVIHDVLQHEHGNFAIEYRIDEIITFPPPGQHKTATLSAAAQLKETESANDYLPLQLFFDNGENDEWRGKLFTLAFHVEEPDADPANQTRFDAVVALLDGHSFGGAPGVDLRVIFQQEQGITLSPAAVVKTVSAGTAGPLRRAVWSIEDQGSRYQLKLEHPTTAAGKQAHTVTAYTDLDAAARMRREYEVLARIGSSADTPGTELPAYCDRFSLDELSGLVDHLRTPYKPGHCYYIHHAQQAIARKKEFFTWWQQRHPNAGNEVLVQDPYTDLSLFEREELRGLAYEFNFSDFWAEVKASSPSATAFQKDLFTEERLADALHIPPEAIAQRHPPDTLDPDSPYTDVKELRALQQNGVERFFAKEKFTFVPPPAESGGISCAEFADVIKQWQAQQGKDPKDIEAALGLLKTTDGKTYMQWAAKLWDATFPVRAGLAMNNMSLLKDGLLVKLAARIPGVATVGAEGIVTTSLSLALLRIWPVIGIPLRMWKEFLDEQMKTDAAWEMIGKVSAMRQWLRRLEMITYEREATFPETLPAVNVSTPVSVEPYYIGRYYEEQIAQYGSYSVFIYAPERMQKGYDEGVRLMDAAAQDIADKANEAVAAILAEDQLDACKIKVLVDAGLFDIHKARAVAVREIARALLARMPRV